SPCPPPTGPGGTPAPGSTPPCPAPAPTKNRSGLTCSGAPRRMREARMVEHRPGCPQDEPTGSYQRDYAQLLLGSGAFGGGGRTAQCPDPRPEVLPASPFVGGQVGCPRGPDALQGAVREPIPKGQGDPLPVAGGELRQRGQS